MGSVEFQPASFKYNASYPEATPAKARDVTHRGEAVEKPYELVKWERKASHLFKEFKVYPEGLNSNTSNRN